MKTFETTRQEIKNVKNVSDLLDFLGELTPEEANKLLYSSEDEVREYAIKYADRKTKIDRLLVEYNSNIVKGILNTIGELTPEEANKLLKANYTYVREYAVKYADRKSKIDRLFVENDSDIVNSILSSIGELTKKEANKLLKANYTYVREYAVKYAGRKNKIDLLLVESVCSIITDILKSIGELTPEEANKLLKANHTYVREYAIKYADRQSKINHLLIEDNHVIIDSILRSLDETPYYLILGREGFIAYFAKYAERESKIKWLLVEHDSSVVDSILKSLGKLTPMEAYQLLNSKNWMAIIYAMRNVNSKDLAKLREIIIKELIN